jgi:hypothetical protein
MGQQIDTIFGVTSHRQVSADIVQQEGRKDGDGWITSVAEITEFVQRRFLSFGQEFGQVGEGLDK